MCTVLQLLCSLFLYRTDRSNINIMANRAAILFLCILLSVSSSPETPPACDEVGPTTHVDINEVLDELKGTLERTRQACGEICETRFACAHRYSI